MEKIVMAIKRYTDLQMEKLPDSTDWARIKKMRDSDIDFSDVPMATPKMLAHAVRPRGRPLKENRKKQLNLRIDSDIVDFFQSTGAGWQTRINDSLRQVIQLQYIVSDNMKASQR
jgi:uncharacterized protein (DUF4415 family)